MCELVILVCYIVETVKQISAKEEELVGMREREREREGQEERSLPEVKAAEVSVCICHVTCNAIQGHQLEYLAYTRQMYTSAHRTTPLSISRKHTNNSECMICYDIGVRTNTAPPIASQHISSVARAGEAALVVGAGLVTATIASGTLVQVWTRREVFMNN